MDLLGSSFCLDGSSMPSPVAHRPMPDADEWTRRLKKAHSGNRCISNRRLARERDHPYLHRHWRHVKHLEGHFQSATFVTPTCEYVFDPLLDLGWAIIALPQAHPAACVNAPSCQPQTTLGHGSVPCRGHPVGRTRRGVKPNPGHGKWRSGDAAGKRSLFKAPTGKVSMRKKVPGGSVSIFPAASQPLACYLHKFFGLICEGLEFPSVQELKKHLFDHAWNGEISKALYEALHQLDSSQDSANESGRAVDVNIELWRRSFITMFPNYGRASVTSKLYPFANTKLLTDQGLDDSLRSEQSNMFQQEYYEIDGLISQLPPLHTYIVPTLVPTLVKEDLLRIIPSPVTPNYPQVPRDVNWSVSGCTSASMDRNMEMPRGSPVNYWAGAYGLLGLHPTVGVSQIEFHPRPLSRTSDLDVNFAEAVSDKRLRGIEPGHAAFQLSEPATDGATVSTTHSDDVQLPFAANWYDDTSHSLSPTCMPQIAFEGMEIWTPTPQFSDPTTQDLAPTDHGMANTPIRGHNAPPHSTEIAYTPAISSYQTSPASSAPGRADATEINAADYLTNLPDSNMVVSAPNFARPAAPQRKATLWTCCNCYEKNLLKLHDACAGCMHHKRCNHCCLSYATPRCDDRRL